MTKDEIRELLVDENPAALLADGLEPAFVGIARRCGQPPLAVYSISRAINHLVVEEGLTPEDAEEHLAFNSIGSWAGPNTPIWLDDRHEE